MDRSEIIDPKVGSIIFLKNWIHLGSIHSGSILTPPGSIQKVFFYRSKKFSPYGTCSRKGGGKEVGEKVTQRNPDGYRYLCAGNDAR